MAGGTASGEALLEREAELEQVVTLLERSRTGHGGILLISGEAGIGKTSLLDAAKAAAASDGEFLVVSARGAELESDFPFGVARQLLEPALAARDGAELARLLAERAYAELRAAGARPRKITQSGTEALTPSEQRVCRLAVEGRTNKEICQALFVTVRTVETHLTHAYQQLEISSREEISAALGAGT